MAIISGYSVRTSVALSDRIFVALSASDVIQSCTLGQVVGLASGGSGLAYAPRWGKSYASGSWARPALTAFSTFGVDNLLDVRRWHRHGHGHRRRPDPHHLFGQIERLGGVQDGHARRDLDTSDAADHGWLQLCNRSTSDKYRDGQLHRLRCELGE